MEVILSAVAEKIYTEEKVRRLRIMKAIDFYVSYQKSSSCEDSRKRKSQILMAVLIVTVQFGFLKN